jgi:phosphatidylinositol alpha-1,6-mannosyltransferase
VSSPVLAAITLDPRGGGVAAVARLLWRVCQDRWSDTSRLVTLLDDSQQVESLTSSRAMRLRFGARLAGAQVRGDSGWILYSHLSLAQVQGFIPAGLRRPYVVFLHGIEAWRSLTRAQRGALEGASLLIANSHYTAMRVTEEHPWIGPIGVCPLSLPPRPKTGSLPAHAPLEHSPATVPALGPRAVLVVGRMSSSERYKGHDQLLEAWPAVIAGLPDAKLVFAGDGDDVSRLVTRARRLRVADSVLFTGFVDDDTLQSLYGQASVFVMPSRNEGFGLVYLEAMSHALPCIGSVHDAAGETIEHGVTGILARQSDIGELAASMTRLLTDETLRRRLGQAGLRRLEDRFSYSRFFDRLTSLVSPVSDAFPVVTATSTSA